MARGEKRKNGAILSTGTSRKASRKLARQSKKSRKDSFFREKVLKSSKTRAQPNQPEEIENTTATVRNKNTIEDEIVFQAREKAKFEKKMKSKNKKMRLLKKDLESGIEEDDLIIKRLEKKLGIKKVRFHNLNY